MKSLITLLTLFLAAKLFASDTLPIVKVYHIQKMEDASSFAAFPELIFEISNPTQETFYVLGSTISSPVRHTEAKRGDKWFRIPNFICGTGMKYYPIKPGAKLLTTVSIPWEEERFRFKYFFSKTAKSNSLDVIVRTRTILRSELGDLTGTIGELDSQIPLEEIDSSTPKVTDDPFKK